ncbi:hypothetical protein GCM10009429_29630 [Dyella marensis]
MVKDEEIESCVGNVLCTTLISPQDASARNLRVIAFHRIVEFDLVCEQAFTGVALKCPDSTALGRSELDLDVPKRTFAYVSRATISDHPFQLRNLERTVSSAAISLMPLTFAEPTKSLFVDYRAFDL